VRPDLGKVVLSTEAKSSRMIAALITIANYRKLQARSKFVNELATEVLRLALRKPVNDSVLQPSRDPVCTIMLRVNNQEYEKLSEIADCHFGGNVKMATCFLLSLGVKNSVVNVSPSQGFMSPKEYIVEPVAEFVVNDPDWPSADDILRARTDLNLSQTELAKKTGMSRRTLRCHEGGIRSLQRVRMLIMRTCMAMGYKPELPPTTS
jgi:DNA-binding XRE family transcriptional regulator